MAHRARHIGLILLALLAGVTATASSALGSTTTYLTGSQVEVNRLDLPNGSNVKCSTYSLKGKFAGSSAAALSLDPSYSGCTSSGQQTTVLANGCFYEITEAKETFDSDHHHATTHIRCPAGKKIEIKVGDPTIACEIGIAEQTPEPSAFIDLTDNTAAAPKKYITTHSTLEGIKITATGSVCGASGSSKQTGEWTLRGYQDPGHVEQVNLWANASEFHSDAANTAEYHSSSGSGSTYLTATPSSVNQFVLQNGANFKCVTVRWTASYSGTTASDVSFEPFYAECSVGLAYVRNGCTTTVTGSIEGENNDTYSPQVHIKCPPGKTIELKFGGETGCVIEYGEQTPTTKLDLTNSTSPTKDIVIRSTLTDIEYTTTPSGGFCGKAGTLQYQGELTLKAYSDASHISQTSIWLL